MIEIIFFIPPPPALIVKISNQEFLFSLEAETWRDKYGDYERIIDPWFDDSTQSIESELTELINARSFVKLNSTSIYKTTVVYKDKLDNRKLCVYYD